METPSSFGRSGAATGHPLVATILFGTLFVMSGFIVAGPATATTVGTGYTAADLIDVQRAVDHLSFDGPAELQKVGVMVVDFILTLSWIRPADGGRAITGIWVELAPADDGGWQSFVAGPLTTSASIGGLVPGREYRVRVSYGNEIGTGSVSGEVRVLVR